MSEDGKEEQGRVGVTLLSLCYFQLSASIMVNLLHDIADIILIKITMFWRKQE